ncbi:MAG: hypothetical protein IIA91_03425 [Chloroflexi bacterium]|nr:hypothetical protein [Chloroflexota bacterium]
MSELRRAIVKSYDDAAHKAAVQIAGSLAVWLDAVRVATNIPPADVVTGRQCTVLFLDPSNQDDAVIIAIQGALPSVGEILVASATSTLTLTTSYQSIVGDGDSTKVRLLLPTPGDWLIEATFRFDRGATNPGFMTGALFVNDSGTEEPADATFKGETSPEAATVPQRWKITTTAANTPVELKAKMENGGGNGTALTEHTRITATGVKRSTGGGGTDHGALTGLGDHDHAIYARLAQAETRAALQTFNAGLRLASSQVLEDSGGAARILLATSSPHLTLTGDVKTSAGLAIEGTTPSADASIVSAKNALGTGALIDRGGLSSSPGNIDFIGLSGKAATQSGGTHTARVIGLEFQAFSNRNLVSPASEITGISVLAGAVFATNVRATLQRGIHLRAVSTFSGTMGVDCRGVEVEDPSAGQSGVTNAYGIKVDPITGATNRYGIHMGAIAGGTIARLLELGTGPELRLLGRGEWTPATEETPLYVAEGATPTLRQMKVDATREQFIQPQTPNAFGPAFTFLDDWPLFALTSAQTIHFVWKIPPDFTGLNSFSIVIIPDATETVQADLDVSVSAVGEDYNADTRQSLNQTKSVTINDVTEWDISGIGSLFTGVAAGDYVAVRFQSDTSNIRVIGARVSWEGDRTARLV